MRSVPLRIASVAAAARSALSSPIVPSERVKSFAVKVLLSCRYEGILQRNDLFEGSKQLSKFIIDVPLRKDHRRKAVLNRRNRAEDTHHLLGSEADDGHSQFISKVSKGVEEPL